MIHLKKGQVLKDNPTLVVYDPSGYYRDEDSVICASAILPEEPVCRFEAKFVAYGGIVYSISNPEELMAEVLKIDPETLFGKTNDNIAVDKMVEEIVPQESGTVEPTEPEEIVEEEIEEEEDVTIPTDTSTSTSTSTSTPTTSTTTPEIILPEEPILPPVIEPTSTSTPEVVSPPTTSTTTPEAVITPPPPIIEETSTTTSSIVE